MSHRPCIPARITRSLLLAILAAVGAIVPTAALADTAPPGDIPDNQAFVTSRGNGFSLKVPEGWTRTTRSGTTSYADKYNGISVAVVKRALAPTISNVRRSDLIALKTATRGFAKPRISGVRRPAGAGVLLRYLAASDPNSVTGKRITLDVERYELWRAGRLLTITLHAPHGSDNVDAWKLVTTSLRWS